MEKRKEWQSIFMDNESLNVRVGSGFLCLPLTLRIWLRVLRISLSVIIRLVPLPKVIHRLSPQRADLDARLLPSIIAYIDKLLGINGNTLCGKCLLRSLLLYHFLRRAGVSAEFNIGLRGERKEFGHSWITDENGQVVFDYPIQRFSVLLYKDPPIVYWFPEGCS